MKHSVGNTVLEYCLIGALIALACVAGCLGFGKNFAEIITGLKTDMAHHSQIAAKGTADASALSSLSSDFGSSITSDTLQLTRDEQILLEQPLDQKLQTTGANGTTELLAKQLDALVARLLAEGKITQDQGDAILRLSNQGHYMAKIEKAVEQGAASQQSTVMFDGQSYDLRSLAAQVGFMNRGPFHFANMDVLADYTEYQEPEMAKFIALYKDVVASGAASDPLVAATIRSASTQIANVGETMEDNIFNPIGGSWNDALASKVTEMNSAYICKAGNFQDGGLLCTP